MIDVLGIIVKISLSSQAFSPTRRVFAGHGVELVYRRRTQAHVDDQENQQESKKRGYTNSGPVDQSQVQLNNEFTIDKLGLYDRTHCVGLVSKCMDITFAQDTQVSVHFCNTTRDPKHFHHFCMKRHRLGQS